MRLGDSTLPPRHFALIFLTALLLAAPGFLLGAGGWDLHCQSLQVRHFSTQFWQGNLYPRWLIDMFAGDGSSVFFYYPPLTYFITALLYFLAPLDPFNFYPIMASAFLALVAAGAACYVWLREETRTPSAALLGSLLYIAAPSNMAQNFYLLMLYSSVWYYVWLPLLMLFARRLAEGKPYAVAGFALMLALLVLTNLPATLIFGPAACGYALFHFSKRGFVRQGMRLTLAVTFGFALAAFYLLPMLMYMGNASIDLVWTRAQFSREPFLTSLPAGQQSIYFLYWGACALLLGLGAWVAPKSRARSFFLCIGAASLFLMLPLSRPLWDMVSILYIVQMSERLFAVTSLALAFFAALTFPRLRALGYAQLPLYLFIAAYVAAGTRVTPESFKAADPARYESYTLAIDQYPQYLPNVGKHMLMQRFGTPEGRRELMKNREQVRVISGSADTQVTLWKPRRIAFRYSAPAPATLQVRQFHFPGWQAFQDGRELETVRDDETGEIRFAIAPGSGEITLTLTALLPEVGGKMISIVSALALLLTVLISIRNKTSAQTKAH